VRTQKHPVKQWEVSLISFPGAKKYKVSGRIPELGVAETKVFNSIEEAKQQFERWLRE
jgi:hypothetical protein